MPPIEDAAATLACLLLLAAAGALLAWILRSARTPGGPLAAGLCAGALAGLLLGATTLGKAAPDLYEQLALGARVERRALADVDRRHEIETAALVSTGVSGVAIDELRARHGAERAPLAHALTGAEHARRAAMDTGAIILFGLILLAGAWTGVGRRPAPDDTPAHNALLTGLPVVFLAGAPAALLAHWTLGLGVNSAAAMGAVIGVGGAFPGLRSRRAGAPGRSEGADRGSLGAYLFGAASVAGLGAAGSPALLFALLAPPIGLFIRSAAPGGRRARRTLRAVGAGVLVPALAAYSALRLDALELIDSRAFWIAALIAVIFATDGRWLGGWLGWWLLGSARARSEAWRRSAAMLNAGVGPVQVGAAIGLASVGLVAPAILAAALIGAIVVELTAGLRTTFARRLDTGA